MERVPFSDTLLHGRADPVRYRAQSTLHLECFEWLGLGLLLMRWALVPRRSLLLGLGYAVGRVSAYIGFCDVHATKGTVCPSPCRSAAGCFPGRRLADFG